MKNILKPFILTAITATLLTACSSGGKEADGNNNTQRPALSASSSNSNDTSNNGKLDLHTESKIDYSTIQDGANSKLLLDIEHLKLKDSQKDGLIWRQFEINHNQSIDVEALSNGNQKGTFKGKFNDIHPYLWVNQPYSTFGFMSYAGHPEWYTNFAPTSFLEHPQFKENYIIASVNGDKIELKQELIGTATYSGIIIKEDRKNGALYDGTVTINATFSKTAAESHVSGKISSDTLGEIALEKTALSWTDKPSEVDYIKQADKNRYEENMLKYSGKANVDGNSGQYFGGFAGPKLDDTAGVIAVGENYRAVFGGTKK